MSNTFIGTGNLGAEPELKYASTQDGEIAVCELRVAFDNTRPDGKGGFEPFDETVWLNVSIWGNAAEQCKKLLQKGKRVRVEGRLAASTSQKDGQKRTFYSVKAKSISIPVNGLDGVTFRSQSDAGQDDDIPF